MKKVALITGASSGFGAEFAKMLDSEGYEVIIAARREERLKNLAKELKNVHILKLDVRNKDEVFRAFDELKNNFGKIDILINNAGLALGSYEFQNTKLEDLETVLQTNVMGVLYVTKAAIPLLMNSKNAYIINLGSTAGAWPYPGSHVYGASKAFVRQFSYNLRNDLQGTNIKVTTIAPGLCKTEFSEVRYKGDKAKAKAVYEGTKYLSSQDLAKVVKDIINLPEHVNINYLELTPVTQTWAGLANEKI